jgi:hypothetical protein
MMIWNGELGNESFHASDSLMPIVSSVAKNGVKLPPRII